MYPLMVAEPEWKHPDTRRRTFHTLLIMQAVTNGPRCFFEANVDVPMTAEIVAKAALSNALTEDELIYLRAQFELLEPKDGCFSLNNFKMALTKNVTDAMKESRVPDILKLVRKSLEIS